MLNVDTPSALATETCQLHALFPCGSGLVGVTVAGVPRMRAASALDTRAHAGLDDAAPSFDGPALDGPPPHAAATPATMVAAPATIGLRRVTGTCRRRAK